MIKNDITDRVISRLAVSFACFVYLAGYAGYSFREHLGPARYLVYAVPGLLLGSLVFQRITKINIHAASYLLAYLTLVFAACLAGIRNTEFFLQDFIIMALIALSFIPVIDVSVIQIRMVFYFSLAYVALNYFFLADHGEIRLLEMIANTTASGLGDGYDDQSGGLLGAIYAVFFYDIGAKRLFFLALIMTILGGKRIGLLAVLICLASIFVFRRAKALRGKSNRFILLFVALAVINIVAVNLNSISEYVYRALGFDVHIEAIMLGRHAIASELIQLIDNRPMLESLVGFGPGSANAVAFLVSNGVLAQPHNDWLKILFDYGIVGSMIVTVFMALIFSSSRTGAVIALSNAIIMMTDNVTQYLFYQVPIVMMVAYSALRESPAQGARGAACSGGTMR